MPRRMSPWQHIEFALLFSQPRHKARMPHQRVTPDFPTDQSGTGPRSVVYIVRIGKFVKIGFSTNLPARLKTSRTSNPDVQLQLAIPGDRALETRLHSLLQEERILREVFRDGGRIQLFVDHVEYGGLQRGLDFLESTTPQKRAERKLLNRKRRLEQIRMEKTRLDARCASLVAERKKRLGW
jgi:hypothetical protein